MSSKKLPKNLGIKIGTQDEAYWTEIKEKCENSIFQHKKAIEMDKTILKLAKRKIVLEERKKLKK